jgi:hypothetical protein
MGIIGVNNTNNKMYHYELYLIEFTISKTAKIDNLFTLKKDINPNSYQSLFIINNPLLAVLRTNESILTLDSERFYLKYSPLDCTGNSDNGFRGDTKSVAKETTNDCLKSDTKSVAKETTNDCLDKITISDNIIVKKIYKIHYSPITYITCQFTTGLTSLLNLYVTRANIELIYVNLNLFYTICRYDNTRLDNLDSEIEQEEVEFETCY